MTVILILVTFVAAIAVDYFLNHKKQAPVFAAQQQARTADAVPRVQPKFVGGFAVNENLKYHPGHTWALAESPNLVRVGVDDFATKLIGKAESIQMPQRGQWIRQGQRVLSFKKNGATIDLVSPIEGSVTELNEAVLRDPELTRTDPYGEGWLMTIQSPDAKTNFRNLMSGTLVRHWTEDAATQLAAKFPKMAMATMADGGTAHHELADELDAQKYSEAVKEFFLS